VFHKTPPTLPMAHSHHPIAQAIGWRFTAGVVTAITSLIYTKSLAVAASIVGWDLCSKSVTMFIGERLWNKVDWGKEDGADSSQRSLAKAIAWRIFAATNTLFAAVVLTKGKAGVAGKIAGTDSVIKTVLFYFYERVWVRSIAARTALHAVPLTTPRAPCTTPPTATKPHYVSLSSRSLWFHGARNPGPQRATSSLTPRLIRCRPALRSTTRAADWAALCAVRRHLAAPRPSFPVSDQEDRCCEGVARAFTGTNPGSVRSLHEVGRDQCTVSSERRARFLLMA
jgi:uncharacterized membrane protein